MCAANDLHRAVLCLFAALEANYFWRLETLHAYLEVARPRGTLALLTRAFFSLQSLTPVLEYVDALYSSLRLTPHVLRRMARLRMIASRLS